MKILNKIITIFLALIIAISIAIVIILMFLFPKKNYIIRKTWAKFIKKLCFYKIEVKGEFDNNARMIILNHRSMLDIIALEDVYPKDLAWIAKKQIEEIFFFGNIIKLPKMISIDRENARDFVRVINEAKDRLESNRNISMFPEGTRNDGYELLRFKKGASMLATKLDVLVQPVVIIGSKEILDSKKLSIHLGKKLTIIPLKPLQANELDNARDLMQEAINEYFKENKWIY